MSAARTFTGIMRLGSKTRATGGQGRVVDRLLMNDDLTVAQHLEAERLIGLAQKAKVYLKSPRMGASSFGGNRPDMMSSGLMRYARYFKRVIRKWGTEGAGILHDHVIEDKHTKDQARINLLAEMLTRD